MKFSVLVPCANVKILILSFSLLIFPSTSFFNFLKDSTQMYTPTGFVCYVK